MMDHRLALAPLLGRHERSVVSCEPITGITAPAIRQRTYMLTLKDGTRLKTRRLSSPKAVATMDRWLGRLAHRAFPRPLAVAGARVLEPWVDGLPLSAITLYRGHFHSAGRILAALHTRNPAHIAHRRTIERRLDSLSVDLERLRLAGVLTPAESRRYERTARSTAPAWEAWGLVHWDFCADNLVQTRGGDIVSVDNVDVSPGALDLDLGRTFTRWPMHPRERRWFLAGYRRARSPEPFLRHEAFWAILAAVASLRYRLEVGSLQMTAAARALHAVAGPRIGATV